MEIRRIKIDEFYALRDLLDSVFTVKNNKETFFIKTFPRFFTNPNTYATDGHLGAFEGDKLIGTAAMYPLDYVVGGEHLRLIANGNVAVHPDYRGRGVMSALLKAINTECDKRADLCYLHGDPVRYERFGYFSGGIQYNAIFKPGNSNGYKFLPMTKEHVAFNLTLWENKSDYIVRNQSDFIPAVRTGYREAVSVFDQNNILVGYISLSREDGYVAEFGISDEKEAEVFSALSRVLGRNVNVLISGYDIKTLDRISPFAKIKESEPALFRIIHPERIREVARNAGIDEGVFYAPYLT